MFHIDKIASQLRKVNKIAEVRGIADSGWFIETGNVPEKGNFRRWHVSIVLYYTPPYFPGPSHAIMKV